MEKLLLKTWQEQQVTTACALGNLSRTPAQCQMQTCSRLIFSVVHWLTNQCWRWLIALNWSQLSYCHPLWKTPHHSTHTHACMQARTRVHKHTVPKLQSRSSPCLCHKIGPPNTKMSEMRTPCCHLRPYQRTDVSFWLPSRALWRCDVKNLWTDLPLQSPCLLSSLRVQLL